MTAVAIQPAVGVGIGAPRRSSSRPVFTILLLLLAAGSGVSAVYLSSAHLSQFPHGAVVLPWQFPPLAIGAFLLTGALLAFVVASRPQWYWSILVFATTSSAGMFVLRFSLFDEWLALAIALGGWLGCLLGLVPRRVRVRNIRWVYLFLSLGLYYLLESLLGYALYDNVKALRYTIIASTVVLIGWTVARYQVPRPTARRVTMILAVAGFTYYTLVILHAVAFPLYAFEVTLEGIGNAGSSDLCVVGIVTMPAAMILIGKERGWRRLLGVIVLIFGAVIAALGDARGGVLAVLLPLIAAPFVLGLRRTVTMWASVFGGAVLLGTIAFNRPEWPLDMAEALMGATNIEGGTIETEYFGEVVAHAKGDAGRFFYVRGAVQALLEEGPRVALLGAGTYGYFPVAGRHYEAVARQGGAATYSINLGAALASAQAEPPRPPALGLIIAETGLVGLLLLGALLTTSLKTVLIKRKPNGRMRILLGANVQVAIVLMLAAGWTYFGDAPATIMFYLLVMPYGIIDTWSGLEDEYTKGTSTKVARNRVVAPGLGPRSGFASS